MRVTDRHLVDDLPSDKLEPILLTEDAGVDHLLVLFDTQAMAD